VDEAVNRFLEGPPSGSLLRKYLSRDIYASLRTAVTRSFHASLWDVIRSGLSRPESELGLYAPDAEAYDTFGQVFLPVIRDYHRLEGFLQHPASYWGEQGAAGGIGVFSSPHVVSTRIRLARSIAGIFADHSLFFRPSKSFFHKKIYSHISVVLFKYSK
jgi:arginine kinase